MKIFREFDERLQLKMHNIIWELYVYTCEQMLFI